MSTTYSSWSDQTSRGSRPAAGSFRPGVTVGTFNTDNQFINGFSTNGTATRAADGFNRSTFRTIAVPVERYLLASRAHYDITPGITAFLEGSFAKSHTETVLEPFAISTSSANRHLPGARRLLQCRAAAARRHDFRQSARSRRAAVAAA